MTEADPSAADTAAALAIFACDPLRTGLLLRGPPGPARDAVLAGLAAAGTVLRRVPPSIAADRLTGGLDLAASLATGREVREVGVLAAAAGQVLVLGAAERWDGARIAAVTAWLDGGSGGVIVCDEGDGADEAPPAALVERCGVRMELPARGCAVPDPAIVARARGALPFLMLNDELLGGLCATAVALGVASLRACVFAARAAAAAAALAGRSEVAEADVVLAARLVLAPRATRLPAAEPQAEAATPPEADPPPEGAEPDETTGGRVDDLVLQAALAALPPNLLAQLAAGAPARRGPAGRAGTMAKAGRRGRPIGSRRGQPRDGSRLDLLATLKAAAPWQRLRGRVGAERLRVRGDDLHVIRSRPRAETTTIFAVDASGSQALARLAEAKGAVELLLADCYVRRDRVAVVAFRGAAATLLLPPTRAPARARRSLAGLPGGGGTPLASGIALALGLADAAARRGETPTIVLLTDGQANIGRDGTPGREGAQADAMAAAGAVRRAGYRCLLIDTANRSQALARRFAVALGARYLALPRADAGRLSGAVRAARA